jgi:hypothetical protein
VVTSTALKWRLVALGRLTTAAARQVSDAALRNNGQPPPLFSNDRREAGDLPPLFSKSFMEVIALAIKDGQMSARCAADVLDMSLDDLAALCTTHGVEVPFDL